MQMLSYQQEENALCAWRSKKTKEGYLFQKEVLMNMKNNLVRKVITAYVLAFILLGLMFFVPAGTINYWQAWVYLVLMFFVAMAISLYLFRHGEISLRPF